MPNLAAKTAAGWQHYAAVTWQCSSSHINRPDCCYQRSTAGMHQASCGSYAPLINDPLLSIGALPTVQCFFVIWTPENNTQICNCKWWYAVHLSTATLSYWPVFQNYHVKPVPEWILLQGMMEVEMKVTDVQQTLQSDHHHQHQALYSEH